VQLYRGEVDLDAYAAVAGLCRHELVYNGDILNLDRFAALSRRFPQQQSWMIGRPAVRDPFLAANQGRALPGGCTGAHPLLS
jgi:tRNA-dihydrouridine synthase